MRRCDRRTPRTAAAIAGVILLIALLCGCTVPGRAGPRALDPRTLDVGVFGTESVPQPPDTDERYGRVLEAVRLAEAVAVPSDIDAALRYGDAAPLPTPRDLVGILAKTVAPTLQAHRLVTAFTTGGMDDAAHNRPILGQTRALRLSVLEFPDDDSARAAAQDIDAVDFTVSTDNVSVPLSKYADAHAHWRPSVPTLAATLAHGPFVVTMYIMNPATDINAMTSLATAAFGVELPMLDRFTPTPPDRLTTLPLDRDGMLRRMLPADPGEWPYPSSVLIDDNQVAGWGGFRHTSGIIYGPNGIDQIVRQDDRQPGKHSPTRPDAMAGIDTRFLVRYPNAVEARKFLERRRKAATGTEDPLPGPEHVPDVVCGRIREFGDPDYNRALKFDCFVLDGRYVANVYGGTEQLVLQRAAAQYALLVRNR